MNWKTPMKFRHLPGWLHDERQARYTPLAITGKRTSAVSAIRDYHQSHGIGYFCQPEFQVQPGHGEPMPSLPADGIGNCFPVAASTGQAGLHVMPLSQSTLPDVRRDTECGAIPQASSTRG